MSEYFENKQLFFINSRNRLTGTDSNFTIKLNINQNINYTHISLVNASIPKTFYSVPSGSSFVVNENGNLININVPVGNYSRNSFKLVLQTLLNTHCSYTYIMTYENITRTQDTGKYFWTVSGNSGIQPIFILSNSGLYEQLGFNRDSSNTFVGDSLQSVNCCNLNAENNLVLHSNIVDDGNNGMLSNILSSSSNSFDYIIYNNNRLHELSRKIVRSKGDLYSFSLTNEDNIPIDLNGLNMTFQIMIFHHSENLYKLLTDYFTYRIERDRELIQ